MKPHIRKFPLTLNLAASLVTVLALLCISYIGQDILIPLILALLCAILLKPSYNFISAKCKLPHPFACFLSVLFFVSVLTIIVLFISWQIGDMASDWDKIQKNLTINFHKLQDYLNNNFNLSFQEQSAMLNQAASNSGKEFIGSTIVSLSDVLTTALLLPIYTFLLLYYQNHFKAFLFQLTKFKYQQELREILPQIKLTVQSYISGLMAEVVMVATLTAIGYSIIGIEYAILLGVITGLLNLIPYAGIAIACLLSIIASLSGSTDLSIIVSVVVVNIIVQVIDNNILVPLIVSAKVKINALFAILGILVGGSIAGVAGMFLAIPMLAIAKVIFDRVEFMKPWGFLIGELAQKKTTRNKSAENDTIQADEVS